MSKFCMMQIGLPRYRVVKDKVTGFYKCHLCSYKSVYGSSLRSHFAVHSSARPYGCDMCSYEAKRLPDLKKHKILKHIRKGQAGSTTIVSKSPLQVFRDPGSGLYRCQHCSYQSDNARCVRSHLAVHSHLRPYACDMCSYEAKRSSDLSKHKIIKHGRIPSRRNKPRNQTNPRLDKIPPVPDFSSVPAGPSNVPMANPSIKHNLGTELDHTDVLSDLDYSLMTPTRAAFEALRRCNMEPLDMFNEYSHHDTFQQNPVFPEPETDFTRRPDADFTRRQDMEYSRRPIFHQTDNMMPPANVRPEDMKGNHGNYVYTNIAGNCNSIQRPINEETVFIKPEPPDDYFDQMNCQVNSNSNAQNKPKPIAYNDHNSVQQKEGSTDLAPDAADSKESSLSENNPESLEQNVGSTSDQQPTSSQSYSELISTSITGSPPLNNKIKPDQPDSMSDDSLMYLERRNVSGSSLITRPFLPSTPARVSECERASADCSQSRESGYSSPVSASMTPQNHSMTGPTELIDLDLRQENLSKLTNTRKSWSCTHCDIMFFDGAMYFMHMGLHNADDPWRCNMCAIKFYDVYGFTSHFVNGHS